jgi:hypothetical protein
MKVSDIKVGHVYKVWAYDALVIDIKRNEKLETFTSVYAVIQKGKNKGFTFINKIEDFAEHAIEDLGEVEQ